MESIERMDRIWLNNYEYDKLLEDLKLYLEIHKVYSKEKGVNINYLIEFNYYHDECNYYLIEILGKLIKYDLEKDFPFYVYNPKTEKIKETDKIHYKELCEYYDYLITNFGGLTKYSILDLHGILMDNPHNFNDPKSFPILIEEKIFAMHKYELKKKINKQI